MKTVFDIGMFDGADSAYYLESGFRVVAVEANPKYAATAATRFSKEIASGQFICVNAALSPDGRPVDLLLSGSDPGSSSLYSDRVVDRQPSGSVRVNGTTIAALCEQFGVPHYLKVDIEGADGICIRGLDRTICPAFLSFEMGEDFPELLHHVASIGMRRFKVISQDWFRELENQNCFRDRLARRLMRELGLREPRLIKRGDRYFISGHSSGPPPWLADGDWYTAEQILLRMAAARRRGELSGWYDLHARAD